MNTDFNNDPVPCVTRPASFMSLTVGRTSALSEKKLADLYTELEDLDPNSCADAVAWVRSEIDRLHYDLTHGSFVTVKPLKEGDYESNQN